MVNITDVVPLNTSAKSAPAASSPLSPSQPTIASTGSAVPASIMQHGTSQDACGPSLEIEVKPKRRLHQLGETSSAHHATGTFLPSGVALAQMASPNVAVSYMRFVF
jgi:hypothetical protein